jgi:membrane protein
MSEEINCPFCGNLIDENAIKCPDCNALFKEPELPNIKFQEFGPFLAIDFLTYGFFATIWFFINAKAINQLTEGKKDGIKLNWLVLLLAINGGFYMLLLYHHPGLLAISALLQCFIYIALTYRVLRIIQKYTARFYNAQLEFNPYYIAIFNVLYLVHFIDTYQDRVYHTYEYFDWKSPQAIFLLILLIIFIFGCYISIMLLNN